MCNAVKTGDSTFKLEGYEDEDEEDEDDMMAVEGSDGQQYVVLEVIQLADSQGADIRQEVYTTINIYNSIIFSYKCNCLKFSLLFISFFLSFFSKWLLLRARMETW